MFVLSAPARHSGGGGGSRVSRVSTASVGQAFPRAPSFAGLPRPLPTLPTLVFRLRAPLEKARNKKRALC